jgi:hypothetical protein
MHAIGPQPAGKRVARRLAVPRLGVLSLAGVLLVPGCGSSSSTSVTAPTQLEKCAVTASHSSAQFPAAGGSGTITVSGERECGWTLASEAPWIVPGQTTGQGDAVVPFTVAPNGTPAARRGAVSVDATRLEVAQDGAACRFTVDPERLDVGPASSSARFSVTAMRGCEWSATAAEPWIRIERGSGNGDGTVELSVSANSGAARTATIGVAGRAVVVAQRAAVAPIVPPGTPAPPSPPTPPTPPPNPAPPPAQPPPPPPAPTPVELEGRVSSLQGSCPNLTFTVAGTVVVTNSATRYREGNCRRVDNRSRVTVVGLRQGDGRVMAERIDLDDDDD